MLATQSRTGVSQELMERLSDARQQSDAIFRLVRTDALYERPIRERHRIVFYIGHLEAFDWNLLHERVLGVKSFDPEFDRLFAFGIDPVGGGLPTDRPEDWPALNLVHDYAKRIRTSLDEKLVDRIVDSAAHLYDDFPLTTLLNVAIEHRLMHVETLAYMLHQLPLGRKARRRTARTLSTPAVVNRMVEIPAGATTLGLSRVDDRFGWDNEYEAHTVEVSAFAMDQYKVTNQQYAEFIAAGGYEDRALWSDDDWNWKTAYAICHPVFWKRDDERWIYRTMFDEVPLPGNWPVYVSQAEAKAFARWVGKSLPTEAEWQRAASGTLQGQTETYASPVPGGSVDPDSGNWDPAPVNAFPERHSAFGLHDMFGNGWEWTSTAFGPFPGFEPFPFYRGYSADFFDNKHFVMKGGSPLTAPCMLRPSFRNWFQAHYQYVYAGFRCVSH